ncbi:hypothetical protein Tco_0057311, partial [Tanacetum coccineum]
MEDEFYHLNVKGNDLKAYVRRFHELATRCPTMVLDSEKMMEVLIRGLPRSIEGNVTVSKPQTLKKAINRTKNCRNKGLATGSNLLPVTVTCHAYKSSEVKNEGEKPTKDIGLKTNEEPVDQEDQAFLEELERL